VFGVKVVGVVRHPVDSRACSWLIDPPAEAFRLLGIELYQPFEVLALEVVGAALGIVSELFGVDETKSLVNELQQRHRGLVEEVMGKQLVSYAELAEVLRRLVREGVSIRDLKLIFESIAAFSCRRGEPEEEEEKIAELHKFIRSEMSRIIVENLLSVGGKLRVFLLSSEFEEEFRAAISVWDRTQKFAPLDPNVETRLRQSVSKIMAPVLERGAVPLVVLCAAEVRAAVHEVLANHVGGYDCVRTLAYEELGGRYQAESLGLLAP
jgi:type III secretory pathway component EscV